MPKDLFDIVHMMHDSEFEKALEDEKFTQEEIDKLIDEKHKLSIYKQEVLIGFFGLEEG